MCKCTCRWVYACGGQRTTSTSRAQEPSMFCLIQSHWPRTLPSGLWLSGQQESRNSLVSVYHLPLLWLQVSTILAFHSIWGSKLRPSPFILQTEPPHWPYCIYILESTSQAYCTVGANLYTMCTGPLFHIVLIHFLKSIYFEDFPINSPSLNSCTVSLQRDVQFI